MIITPLLSRRQLESEVPHNTRQGRHESIGMESQTSQLTSYNVKKRGSRRRKKHLESVGEEKTDKIKFTVGKRESSSDSSSSCSRSNDDDDYGTGDNNNNFDSDEEGTAEGVTSLMVACQQGLEHDVTNIIYRKPQMVAEKDRTGKTAAHYCAENQNLNCIDQIINAEPSLLNERDEEGYTPLHLAVISGNKVIVKYLISKGADTNAVDNEQHSAVHWATVCGELECLDILVDEGADPSTPDIHGAYPLHYAAQMCGPNSEMGTDTRVGLTVLKRLISRGVNVHIKDHDGRQPLMWAASAGSTDGILSLVNAGASVESVDKDGLTALHCAASRGHHDCIETLVGLCGAEVDVTDNNGSSPLFYAVTLGHADCASLVLTYGADPNKQDKKGRSPAHCGAAKGQLETIKILAANNANLWLTNIRGDFPLHEAVHSGRKDLVRWLLSLKPKAIDASNNDGKCPLHIAAINNNVELCKILIDNKAAVNSIMRNSKGHLMTPLDAALYRGNRGCAKYVQLHGGVPASKITDKSALQKALAKALSEKPSNQPERSGDLLETTERPPKETQDQQQKQPTLEGHRLQATSSRKLSEQSAVTESGEGSSPVTVLRMPMEEVSRKPGKPASTQTDPKSPSPPPKPLEVKPPDPEVETRETQTSRLEAENKEVMTDAIVFEPPPIIAVSEEDNKTQNGLPEEERSQTRTLIHNQDDQETHIPSGDDFDHSDSEDVHRQKYLSRDKVKHQYSDEGALADSDSVPSRATDVASTLKDSGYSDVVAGGSRNLSPEEDMRRVYNQGGGGLLRTITDGLEEEQEEEEAEEDQRHDDDRDVIHMRQRHLNRQLRMVDKPELISPDLPPDFVNHHNDMDDRYAQSDTTALQMMHHQQQQQRNGRHTNDHRSSYAERPRTSGDAPSITQYVQNSLRKYQMERKIFEELLELKRLQIRAGRANEQVLVKRLSDSYAKTIRDLVGLRTYDGPFTFKEFEKYLYSQLRSSQYGRPSSMPGLLPSARSLSREVRIIVESKTKRITSSNQLRHVTHAAAAPRGLRGGGPLHDDLERLSSALKRHGIDSAPLRQAYEMALGGPIGGGCGKNAHGKHDASDCTHVTHRCHHAAHAYTGLPCVQYRKPKSRNIILPKIDNGRRHSVNGKKRGGQQQHQNQVSSQAPFDPKTPLTLELHHGSQKHKVSLPTETLDKSKKYYVTFTINRGNHNGEGNGKTQIEEQERQMEAGKVT